MTVQPILAASDTWFTQGGTSIKRASITEIEIKDSYTPSGTVTTSWDASAAKDGSVMAYVEGTKLTIAGNGSGKVFMNPDSSKVFNGFTKMTSFVGSDMLNASKATTLKKAFYDCTSLTSLDLNSWDTSNVENLHATFNGMLALNTLSVSNWNTSKVTNMRGTFQCSVKLTELDLTNWTTDNVTTMHGMFSGLDSYGGPMALVEIVGLEDWDVSKVTTMAYMFQNCTSLTTIGDTTNWNTESCADMSYMFNHCEGLTTIGDTTNWNPKSCTNMQAMFKGCTSLEELNTVNWDVSKVTTMAYMFQNCTSLTTIGDTTNWNTESCADMSYMFNHCTSLEELNVANWDVSKVTTFHGMFSSPSYANPPMIIKELDVSKWDTSSATDMSFMFYGCKGPKTIDVSNWDVSKVTNFDHMIAHSGLTLIGVDNWAPSTACTNMNAMFHSIKNTTIDVSKYNTSKVQFFSQMFENANKLTEIIGLENWDTSSGLGFEEMFQSCSSLKELDLSSFDTTKAKDGVLGSTNGHTTATMQYMFNGMHKLEKITLGEKFTFQGDGTTTDPSHHAVLPTPSASNIADADGYWYDINGNNYAPSAVFNLTYRTYYASPSILQADSDRLVFVKNGTLMRIAEAIRSKSGKTSGIIPSQFAAEIIGLP